MLYCSVTNFHVIIPACVPIKPSKGNAGITVQLWSLKLESCLEWHLIKQCVKDGHGLQLFALNHQWATGLQNTRFFIYKENAAHLIGDVKHLTSLRFHSVI